MSSTNANLTFQKKEKLKILRKIAKGRTEWKNLTIVICSVTQGKQ